VTRNLVTGPREAWPDEQAVARAESGGSFELLRAEREARRAELPEAADFHRLPLEWHQEKARQLKAEASERGVDGGLFLTNRWNVIYATGLLHTGTERPFACFLPMDDDDALIWFHPYLDTALVESWWCTRAFAYFDHHHAEGAWPSRGEVRTGNTVDLYRWWGETLASLGYAGKTIGIDSGGQAELGLLPGWEKRERLDFFAVEVPEPHRPEHGPFGRMAAALPDSQFVDCYDILIRQRAVKDEAETRLVQRAMDVLSEIHAFARDYLLERGAGAIDWEVANAARLWGMQRLMDELPHSGLPHETVGADIYLGCRTGPGTAYPHPNQAFWTPVEGGHALQIAGLVHIGGYGGEQYRSFLVAPWTDWQEQVWDVHTRAYEIQAEESYAGNTCSNVAAAVHRHQVEGGCAHLVYHRPGHSQGMEGHQPPYQALGDYTVLRAGMHFSNEPGLYDVEHGFGFNHGNNILVAEEKGLQMGTAPCTKEWCLLEL
jgi:Xaa-Pro dipeptidase